MFPYMRLEITGLDPDARYFVLLETVLSSGSRYKFSVCEWTPVGTAEPQLPPSARLCLHPDSPATGAHWMTQHVTLNKIKLTNNNLDRCGNVSSYLVMELMVIVQIFRFRFFNGFQCFDYIGMLLENFHSLTFSRMSVPISS